MEVIPLFKNKLFMMTLIIVIAIIVLSIGSYFIYQAIFPNNGEVGTSENKEEKAQSIDDILPLMVNVPKVNTNLGDGSIIVLEITLQTDQKKAAEEAQKRMPQIQDRINLFLKNLTMESFSSEENIMQFKTDLIERINTIMQEGKVVHIDVTNLFLQ